MTAGGVCEFVRSPISFCAEMGLMLPELACG
jgi:hypothetical protein